MLLADQQQFREIIELIVDSVNTEPEELECNKTVGTNMESTIYKLKQDNFPLFRSLQQLRDAIEVVPRAVDFDN
jgi:hypothetical protein